MAPKRRILEGVLPFSGKKLFVKSDVKISACFMQNFMKLDMKKKLDLKAVIFGVWGLKTSLGQFGPKAFVKTRIKL